MCICYFQDLLKDRIFPIKFDSPYKMRQFLKKCKYSKKIRYIGNSI